MGPTVWQLVGSAPCSMTTPAMDTGDRLAVAWDAGGTALCAASGKDGQRRSIFSQTPEQTIFDADLSSGGYSAMLTAGDSGRSLLQVYDPNGSLLYKRSTKSHYLSACAVSPDGSHAAAVALGQADITFSASLQLYRTDSEEIAAECALGSEMPYDIAFVTDSVVCAVSEEQGPVLCGRRHRARRLCRGERPHRRLSLWRRRLCDRAGRSL